jgi:hypothetical protein
MDSLIFDVQNLEVSQRFSALLADEIGVDVAGILLNDQSAANDVRSVDDDAREGIFNGRTRSVVFDVVSSDVLSTDERRVVAAVLERVDATAAATNEVPLVAELDPASKLSLIS